MDQSYLRPNLNRLGFARVAAVVPTVTIINVSKNVDEAVRLAKLVASQGASVVVFPELNLTGYTCKDLFLNSQLIKDAWDGLIKFAMGTSALPIVSLVGLPLMGPNHKLYNVAAVVSGGEVLGFVPKSYLPNYGEFEEKRWFSEAETANLVMEIPFERKFLLLSPYQTFTVNLGEGLSFTFGITICEDDWRIPPPSYFLAMSGATVIFNLSASNELVTKVDFRRQMIKQRSSDAMCGYVYCSAGPSESTADLVFGGHCLIYDNGSQLAERRLRDRDRELIIADIDISSLVRERVREGTWGDAIKRNADLLKPYQVGATINIGFSSNNELSRIVDPRPFVPSDQTQRNIRCEEIIELQVEGLYQRLLKVKKATGKREVVIGVSGGLDSTLALLITVRTFELLGWDKKGIIAVTMPGPGTSNRTYDNSVKLIKALGVNFREISIVTPVTEHLRQLGHEPCWKCLQCQNAQARERTQILFDLGFVIGTGDLSEAAQGWCTYNGDHMSSYNVNCDIPKTLVRYLTSYFAYGNIFGGEVADILGDILDTPISPELVKAEKEGEIGQKTEDEIGPYDLHDFFLYHLVRKGESPDKIFYLACLAFKDEFEPKVIIKWLRSFYRRFFANQFKRDCVPNGPMVGTISFSPRGYWRMPSDAGVPSSWQMTLDNIEREFSS